MTKRREHRRTLLGMSRTFQHSSLFGNLTARENVAIAVQRRQGHARNLLRPARSYEDVEQRSSELLAQTGLAELGGTPVAALSHGHRRQLDVALALAADPELLLLDEPTAGMARDEAKRLLTLIGELPEALTVMLVEHDMDMCSASPTRCRCSTPGG